MEKYSTIIGLEIHVELNTKSKMFCQCPADYFGADPNTHTCPVCLGMPGGLPVPNSEAIDRTIMIGQALNCKINNNFKFDRKHYFYPDLAKGYQISQYDEPIAENGEVTIIVDGEKKSFGITRVHLEEDTGKLTHSGKDTLIDFNRGGVPLVEIVTEPDFSESEDVKAFLEELQTIVRYLGVAHADMEKGDMRLEPNISVQFTEKLPELPEYKVEVKNINSFKFVKDAIDYERERHIEFLDRGEIPPQETRGWDSNNKVTVSQRIKEDAKDYRYFPEPDIPPFRFEQSYINDIKTNMPELPFDRVERYIEDFGIKYDDAFFITRDKDYADYFEALIENYEEVVAKGDRLDDYEQAIANDLVNKKISDELKIAEFIKKFIKTNKPVETDMDKLTEVIDQVVSDNDQAVEDYISGSNPNSIMYLVGQVMKEMRGQADAQVVKSELEKKLDS